MKRLMNISIVFLLGLVLTGCSLKYDLNPPHISATSYEINTKKQYVVYVDDNRKDKNFIDGMQALSGVKLSIGNVEEPVVWLANYLEKEFLSRNVFVSFTTDVTMKSSSDAIFTVNKYKIINSRTTGFHPYIAYHSFSGTIKDSESNKSSIVSYFVYGKTPVWSMNELQEPCFDMPSAILIKGIAAKVNRIVFNYSMNDSQLSNLIEIANKKILSADPHAYLSVLEIGQSNNQKAIKHLKKLAENSDTLIRACALAGFGMIGEISTFSFLKEKYSKYNDIDRFMALTSIGDLGTPESIQLLKDARNDQQYTDEYGFKFAVDLYLESIH